MKKCPVCGVSVKVENLERHVRNQHPHETVDLDGVLTPAEQRVARRKSATRPAVTARGIVVISAVLFVVALLFAVAVLNPFRGTGPGVGQYAPEFTVPSSSGGVVTLSTYRGTPVLLEFMDVDCGACEREASNVLRYVYENYSASVEFLSVSVDFVGQADTLERIDAFRTSHGTPWTYAHDRDRVAREAYGVSATPMAFFLDRNGIIVHSIRGSAPGGIDAYAEWLDKAIRA